MQNRKFVRKKRKKLSAEELFKGIRSGNLSSLSQGITCCESLKKEDREKANKLIKLCLPYSGNSIRIGITGVPGVGKSTFIESFGLHLIQQHQK